MGSVTELELRCPKDKHARWARHVAEDMIKLLYAPCPSEYLPAPSRDSLPLSEMYLEYREQLAPYDVAGAYENTAMDWLERRGTRLVLERCRDLQGPFGSRNTEDFFPQLCFAYALRFPQVPFTGVCRNEMTVSGSVTKGRVMYDGKLMCFQFLDGMLPFDEDDWSRSRRYYWICSPLGEFVPYGEGAYD